MDTAALKQLRTGTNWGYNTCTRPEKTLENDQDKAWKMTMIKL